MNDLDRLENQAAAIDAEISAAENPQPEQTAAGVAVLPPLQDELADMLDMVAVAGSMLLPTMPQHFNHGANVQIATAIIKLSDKYGYDVRASLLVADSPIMLWLGLGFAIGVPARACLVDLKAIKEAAKVAAAKATQPAANDPLAGVGDGLNEVVTGTH